MRFDCGLQRRYHDRSQATITSEEPFSTFCINISNQLPRPTSFSFYDSSIIFSPPFPFVRSHTAVNTLFPRSSLYLLFSLSLLCSSGSLFFFDVTWFRALFGLASSLGDSFFERRNVNTSNTPCLVNTRLFHLLDSDRLTLYQESSPAKPFFFSSSFGSMISHACLVCSQFWTFAPLLRLLASWPRSAAQRSESTNSNSSNSNATGHSF